MVFKFFTFVVIVVFLCVLPESFAQEESTTGLGYLQAFSVFVNGDITASSSNTKGRMAAAGSVNLQSYSVGQALIYQCKYENITKENY